MIFLQKRFQSVVVPLCFTAFDAGFGGRKRHGRHGGPGGPWGGKGFGRGPWGGLGRHGGPGGRRFARGDLKYVILDLLKEQPRHGYDIIQALEERFHGFYSPSPGSVYPTLQLLQDQGYVTSLEQDGKRTYSITDAGRGFLSERSEVMDDVRTRMHGPWGQKLSPEVLAIADEMRQLGQVLFREGAHGVFGDVDTARRVRSAIATARTEIERIIAGKNAATEEMV